MFDKVNHLVSILHRHACLNDLLSVEVPAGIVLVNHLINVACLKFVQTLSERKRLGVTNVDLVHDLIDNLVSDLL